jgi:hypothetical protein
MTNEDFETKDNPVAFRDILVKYYNHLYNVKNYELSSAIKKQI